MSVMKRREYIKSFLLVLLAVCFWGFSFIWSKQLLAVMSGTVVIFLRVIIASLLMVIVGKAMGRLQRIKRRDIGAFMLLSVVQPFLYFTFELLSLEYNSPTITALVIAQIPLVLALVNAFIFKHGMRWSVLLGIVVSIGGVSLVILGGENAALLASPIGLVMAAMATLCAVAYNIMVDRLIKRYNPLTITAYIHIIAFFYFLPIVMIFYREELLGLQLTVEILYPLLALGILCSALGFLFYISGVKTLGVVTSSMIINLSPAITSLGMLLLFSESLQWVQTLGIVITVLGLSIGAFRPKRRVRRRSKYKC